MPRKKQYRLRGYPLPALMGGPGGRNRGPLRPRPQQLSDVQTCRRWRGSTTPPPQRLLVGWDAARWRFPHRDVGAQVPVGVRQRARPAAFAAPTLVSSLLRCHWAQSQQVPDVDPHKPQRSPLRWCALWALLWLSNRPALPPAMARRPSPTPEFRVRRAHLARSVAELPRVPAL